MMRVPKIMMVVLVCHEPASRNVTMSCTGNVVTITWPTDVVYRGDVIIIPKDVNDRIYAKMRGQIGVLQIFVTTKMPP